MNKVRWTGFAQIQIKWNLSGTNTNKNGLNGAFMQSALEFESPSGILLVTLDANQAANNCHFVNAVVAKLWREQM